MLTDTVDKLFGEVTLKNVMTLILCVIKDYSFLYFKFRHKKLVVLTHFNIFF